MGGARTLYRESLAMKRRIHGPAAHPSFFVTLCSLQRSCVRAGMFIEAKEHAKVALECTFRFAESCDASYRKELMATMQAADQALCRGEKEKCPCGSGEKYKRC